MNFIDFVNNHIKDVKIIGLCPEFEGSDVVSLELIIDTNPSFPISNECKFFLRKVTSKTGHQILRYFIIAFHDTFFSNLTLKTICFKNYIATRTSPSIIAISTINGVFIENIYI